MTYMLTARKPRHGGPQTLSASGFTLIELVLVLLIIAVIMAIPIMRSDSLEYWKHDGFIGQLRQTISFLHTQAMLDGVFYRMEFGLEDERPYYRIGEIVPEEETYSQVDLSSLGEGAGTVSTELALFLHPSLGTYQNMIEPRSFPSLAKPVFLPTSLEFEDISTMRGKEEPGQETPPYIIFSPRGFSEFAVIHLKSERGRQVTILVNPFTGLTELFNTYEDFKWTYGRGKQGES